MTRGKRRWRAGELPAAYLQAHTFWTGYGQDALEVAYATADRRPPAQTVRQTWKKRHGYRRCPVLLIIGFVEHGQALAQVCGPSGDHPPVVTLALSHAERIAATALGEPDRYTAHAFVARSLADEGEAVPGLRNRGLLSSHEIAHGVPKRPDWDDATSRAQPLLGLRGQDLVDGLGYIVEDHGRHSVLRTNDGYARAVAVFLHEDELPDLPSARHNHQTPVTYGLTRAEQDNLPYVISVRNNQLRLYSTATSGAAGQRGRTETYVELDLPLLAPDQAGYLDLLFSARALAENGSLSEIQRDSAEFTNRLSERLRERVYREVVPRLAVAVARVRAEAPTQASLDEDYHVAMTILFRLLFIAYGEDARLLPLHVNAEYTGRSLKSAARDLADRINAEKDLGFDNPLTEAIEPTTDPHNTDLWDRCLELFHAVDRGHKRWGVPVYNGGLFSTDAAVSAVGARIENLSLTNGDFGPALTALIVDRTPDGIVGPIDFRDLSVREFGTLYEGLLESELSVADQPLTIDNKQQYVPAKDPEKAIIPQGGIYLHNQSGQRKSTGSYFTKPFAVEHLIRRSVDPAIDAHVERVGAHLDAGDEAAAAAALFDFRIADIAMGSGHFLTAAVDRVEARFAAFLAGRPIPAVTRELDELRAHAQEAMGDLAVEVESSALLRRMIARRCIYGVDRNRLAVELARVALWIHTFIPGLPLSFLNHNLVVGDSLTGVATLEEAREVLTETGPQRSHFDAPIEEALHRSEEPLRRLANIADATPKQVQEARKAAADAEQAVEPLRALLDLVVAYRTGDKADPPTLDSAEGLDELVDHPDRQSARTMEALHFPVAFPEVFLRERPGFDAILGNPPWEEATVERLGFWTLRFPGLKSLKQKDQKPRIEQMAATYPALQEEYERERDRAERLRTILTNGPFPGMGTGDPDLYKAFCWRFWHLAREDGAIGVVLPRSALSANGTADWRRAVLEGGTFGDVTFMTNTRGWVFDEAEHRYTIALVAIRKGEEHTGTLYVRGPYASQTAYTHGMSMHAAALQRDQFLGWTDTASFPLIPSPEAFDVFVRLRAHPRLDADTGDWRALPAAELHATNDKKHMILDGQPGDGHWPVYKGASFDLWTPDTGDYYARADPEYITRVLQDKRVRQQRHARSAFSAFSPRWANDPATLPCRHPRIAFRDITRATDTRTVRCALVPAEVVLNNKAPYFVWPRGDASDQAFLLGVLSSMPLDWYARRFVEVSMNFHILNAFPIPRPARDHHLHQVVVDTAGRLAAVDERFSEWADNLGVPVGSVRPDEKDTYLARLDAAVALLYGLTREELHTLYTTFHEGWDSSAWEQAVLREYETLEPYAKAVEAG